jgi:hypothetical protein
MFTTRVVVYAKRSTLASYAARISSSAAAAIACPFTAATLFCRRAPRERKREREARR